MLPVSYLVPDELPSFHFFKMYILTTDVLEIEDVQGRKRVAPPPTDQTRGPKWSIFWRGITCGILLRGIEAIFKFRPTSGDTGV